MAEHDPARIAEVLDWPLRELFLAFIERMRDRAWRSYELDVLVWAVLAPYQKQRKSPPELPSILR